MTTNENISGLEEITRPLWNRPDWSTMSAADRTYAACDVLQNAGFQIPSWTVIRSLIGKGSGNDINNAKKRFLNEHADRRKKMNGIPEDLPRQLLPVFKTLWAEAVSCAVDSIKTNEGLLTKQIEQLEDELAKSDESISQIQLEIAELENKLALAKKDVANYSMQLESERAARTTIEKTFQKSADDAKAQHDLLMDSLRTARTELDKAAERMESQENRALRMIDEIKTESGKRIQAAEAKTAADRAEHQIQLRRIDAQLKESKVELEQVTKRNSELTIDNGSLRQEVILLREQLQNSQQMIDSLSLPRRSRRFAHSLVKNMDTKKDQSNESNE